VFGVGEAEDETPAAAPPQQFRAVGVKLDEWLTVSVASDLDVAPAESRPNAGAERFAHRFFCCEAGGEVAVGEALAAGVVTLSGQKNFGEELFAEFFDGSADAIAFDQVESGAKDGFAHKENYYSGKAPGRRWKNPGAINNRGAAPARAR
jgi:hypothetical protein